MDAVFDDLAAALPGIHLPIEQLLGGAPAAPHAAPLPGPRANLGDELLMALRGLQQLNIIAPGSFAASMLARAGDFAHQRGGAR
jgi:hypothetical protein